MPTKTYNAEFLRAAIEANGWGDISESQPYSAVPIDADALAQRESPGNAYPVDPQSLTEEQEQLIADCFKLVAACLLRDEDGTYTELLETLMNGGE